MLEYVHCKFHVPELRCKGDLAHRGENFVGSEKAFSGIQIVLKFRFEDRKHANSKDDSLKLNHLQRLDQPSRIACLQRFYSPLLSRSKSLKAESGAMLNQFVKFVHNLPDIACSKAQAVSRGCTDANAAQPDPALQESLGRFRPRCFIVLARPSAGRSHRAGTQRLASKSPAVNASTRRSASQPTRSSGTAVTKHPPQPRT